MDAPARLTERLPALPEWVPYPHLVWFVVEGLVLALLGTLVRDLVGPSVPAAVVLGNVVLFVGVSTAVLGGVAYFVLVSVRQYR